MSGAGNDFVVIDRGLNPGLVLNSSAVKNLCDRRNGIGADGVITIDDSGEYDFLMEYFNADGSTGSLCGNGARCAVKFAENSGRIKEGKTRFLSNGSEYYGEVLGPDVVKFHFGVPGKPELNFEVSAGGQKINAAFIDTGSPHVVIDISGILKDPGQPDSNYGDINDVPVFELGREIRNLPEFAPGGTNVNFISFEKGRIYIRTFERGVENETLACGTGNAAAAIILNRVKNISPPVKLITRGGDELTVDFSEGHETINDLTLTGPVKVVFTGEYFFYNNQN